MNRLGTACEDLPQVGPKKDGYLLSDAVSSMFLHFTVRMNGLLGELSRVKLAFLKIMFSMPFFWGGDDLQLDKDFSWGGDHYLKTYRIIWKRHQKLENFLFTKASRFLSGKSGRFLYTIPMNLQRRGLARF